MLIVARDAMRERQREAEKAYHGREKDLRSAIGYTAWADKKDEELKKKAESSRCTFFRFCVSFSTCARTHAFRL